VVKKLKVIKNEFGTFENVAQALGISARQARRIWSEEKCTKSLEKLIDLLILQIKS